MCKIDRHINLKMITSYFLEVVIKIAKITILNNLRVLKRKLKEMVFLNN